MIDRNVPIYLVKILCYWYQHQEMIVQWGSCLSDVFFVTNDFNWFNAEFDTLVSTISEIGYPSYICGNFNINL